MGICPPPSSCPHATKNPAAPKQMQARPKVGVPGTGYSCHPVPLNSQARSSHPDLSPTAFHLAWPLMPPLPGSLPSSHPHFLHCHSWLLGLPPALDHDLFITHPPRGRFTHTIKPVTKT